MNKTYPIEKLYRVICANCGANEMFQARKDADAWLKDHRKNCKKADKN